MRRAVLSLLIAGAAVAAPTPAEANICWHTEFSVLGGDSSRLDGTCIKYDYGVACDRNWVWKEGVVDFYLGYCYPILF